MKIDAYCTNGSSPPALAETLNAFYSNSSAARSLEPLEDQSWLGAILGYPEIQSPVITGIVKSLLNHISLLERKVSEYESVIGKTPFRGRQLNAETIQKKSHITPAEAAVLLGGSADTVKRDCRRIGIEPRRTGGGHWLLSKDDVQKVRRYRSEL